ncbi:hypothetical protein CVT26_007988 [Gymnopilus dilepis]|uniref:Uncharacterized protein n=1 Tax=Gymnopilus dilepis TaxID=231916 RepID=A0A409WEK9_9AGAR|nr:hypothetical protein CVT26_007988 [Gymnopilus dilepis]
MAEYYPSHHPSREPSYRGELADEHAMRRSITRGSHQSQPSVSESTRSWVQANQMMRPPPPLDDSTPSPTPARRPSRPLPDPALHQSRSSYHYAPQDVDHGEQHVEAYSRPVGDDSRLPFGFPTDELGDETPSHPIARPIQLGSSPIPPHADLIHQAEENRSFVGGFISGIKRLPKILRGGGSKQKLKRKGTFGTDLTNPSTATLRTRENTLPRYLSNPSIGPTNPQFAHRLSMAVANGNLPPGSTPAVFHVRENAAGPHFPHPVVTVTPPSDSNRITEEQAEYFDGPMDERPDHFMGSPNDQDELMGPNPQERTTVMVYNTDSQAPSTMPPPPPQQPRQPTPGPRVSYQAQLPTRANVQLQSDPPPGPPQMHFPTPMRPPGILQSPPQNQILSPSTTTHATSSYTISAAPSFYDPSYSSSLTPIEKFFKGLYNLPWVAHERITVDYRPADSKRAQDKIRGLKKPMASWYRSLIPRSRRTTRSLDLLSGESETVSSQVTSLGHPLTPLASPTSPISRRSGRSSQTNGRSGKPKRHHRKKRYTMSSSTTVPRRTSSPIIPTIYPYAYPGYPYAYPYGTYPPAAAVPIPTIPRGPRKHKSKRAIKYANGYAPYQPMAMPPTMPAPMPTTGQPVYYIAPSPPQSANGGEGSNQPNSQPQPQYVPMPPAGPQPFLHPSGMQVSPVLMHYVPGAFNPHANLSNHAMASPPLTPQRADMSGGS